MKISIITVCYNSEATIIDTIKSVLSQKNIDLEYIIIDGGSTDQTLSIINKYADKISKIISEPDKGIYDAMNKGIALASGDVVGILNSDDLYQDDMVLESVTECFNEDSKLDLVYGDLVYVDGKNTDKVVRRWKSTTYYNKFFERGNVPPHPTLFLKSKVYNTVGLFNLKYRLAADYEFMLRVFKKHDYKPKYLNRLMVRMRLGGATNKSVKNIINGNREIIKAWKDLDLRLPLWFIPVRVYKRIIQFL